MVNGEFRPGEEGEGGEEGEEGEGGGGGGGGGKRESLLLDLVHVWHF